MLWGTGKPRGHLRVVSVSGRLGTNTGDQAEKGDQPPITVGAASAAPADASGSSLAIIFFEGLGTVCMFAIFAMAMAMMIVFGGTGAMDAAKNAALLASSFLVSHTPLSWVDRGSFALSPGYSEIFQPVYGSAVLGSFNWALLLTVGAWILASFAVYTSWFNNDAMYLSEGGKPVMPLARCGFFFTFVSFLWNLLGVMCVLIFTFRDGGMVVTSRLSEGASKVVYTQFPVTTTTVALALPMTLLATLYFLRELKEFFAQRSVAGPWGSSTRYDPDYKFFGLKGFIRVPPTDGISDANFEHFKVTKRRQYTPMLCGAWVDSHVVTDPLFLVGVIGTTLNVVSFEVGSVFLTLLYLGMARAAMLRMIMEAYVVDVPDDGPYKTIYDAQAARKTLITKKAKNEEEMEALFELRMVSMLVHFATLFLSIAVALPVLSRFQSSSVTVALVVLCVVLRAVGWLVAHLGMEFEFSGLDLRTSCMLEFNIGLIVKIAILGGVWMYTLDSIRGDTGRLADTFAVWRGAADVVPSASARLVGRVVDDSVFFMSPVW